MNRHAMLGWCFLAAGVAAAALWRSAAAATLTYNVTVRGTSTTLSGQKFRFTGTGTLMVDDQTGQGSLSLSLSNGTHLTGTGLVGAGERNVFGTFALTQGPSSGTAVISGTRMRTTFSGKFTAGIPDRLGPAPGGFVHSAGSIRGEQKGMPPLPTGAR